MTTTTDRAAYVAAVDHLRQASALGQTAEVAYWREQRPGRGAHLNGTARRLGFLAVDAGSAGAAIAREAQIMGAFVIASADIILRRTLVHYQSDAIDYIGRRLVECGFPEPAVTLENPDQWGLGERALGFKESADLDPAQYARFRRDVLGADEDADGEPTLGSLTAEHGHIPAQSYHWHEGWGDGVYDPTSDLIADAYVSEYLPPFASLSGAT